MEDQGGKKQKVSENGQYASVLESAGLNKNEAKVYELLLNRGQMGISKLNKLLPDIKRTNLYSVLYSLRDMGVVEQTVKNKKINFKPADPNQIKKYVLDQKTRYSEAENMISSILPALSEKYKMTTEKPIVRVYEGREGIKEIYEDTLKVGKPILAFLTSKESDPKIWQWLRDVYVKKRIKAGIFARVIVSEEKKQSADAKEYVKENKNEFRETRVVNYEIFPSNIEIQIYGSKVSFANYNKNDAPVGVIIDNKNIAKSMRGLFELAWRSADDKSILGA